jgi:hypothetical protein
MKKTIVDPSCPTGWVEKEFIGEGSYSTIHKVCCGDNCNFALKRNRPYEKINLKKEATDLTKCANAGLCPKVHYSSDDEFIMDKLDLPVYKLFSQYRDPAVNKSIVKSIFDLLDQLHQIGFLHGDLHLGNIMVKDQNPNVDPDRQMSEIERYNQHNYRYYFIDISGIEIPSLISPSEDAFLDDWDLLIIHLNELKRPYLDPLITEKVKELIDPSISDPDTGVTNLMILVVNKLVSNRFIRRLLENVNPDIINQQDYEGNTVLHHVAAQKHPYKTPIYKMLIEAGADPKIKNHGGFLPVDYEQNPEDRKFLEGL